MSIAPIVAMYAAQNIDWKNSNPPSKRSRKIQAAILVGSLTAAGVLLYSEHVKDITMQESFQSDENSYLFKAVQKGDLNRFKEAVKLNANINSLNVRGDNCLMAALRKMAWDGQKSDIVEYILTNSEIYNQLDFKTINKDGKTALDIINEGIEKRRHHKKKQYRRSASDFEKFVVSKIKENMDCQNKEEVKGKTRSNTKYDAFAHLIKNNSGNTGL